MVMGDGPDTEGKDLIYPFFWVAVVFIFAQNWLMSGKAIRAKVLLCWDVGKFEVKKLDGSNPLVHCCIGLDIWVV